MQDFKQKIIFLLPKLDYVVQTGESTPIGGFKVIYEYANRLVADGFDVLLVYPGVPSYQMSHLRKLLFVSQYFIYKLTNRFKAGEWFALDKRIKKKICSVISRAWLKLPSNSTVIATGYDTSVALQRMQNIKKHRKFYFIQDYEIWRIDKETLESSYRLGLTNITIAPWIQDIIINAGAEATVIMNGFDFTVFNIINPIKNRNRNEVVMLYHIRPQKRCRDAFAALNMVKEKNPLLHVTLFGVFEPPENLPEWYTYCKLPTPEHLCEIYNNASIYVSASDTEGFGLTVGEAMICGCAVACTDNGGFRCMAKHNETALLSPVRDVKSLASNIETLIRDDALRIKIAKQGNDYIKSFTWDNAYKQFKTCLLNNNDKVG